VFTNPLWNLTFGVLYALFLPCFVTSKDAHEGAEEFAFSLPPTRSQLFATRLAFCGLPFVAMLGAGLVAIAFDVPQVFWGLVVESGFTEPFDSPLSMPASYAYAVAVPVAIFAFMFALGAVATGRGSARAAWIGGVILPGILVAIGLFVETRFASRPTGVVTCPALLVASAVVLVAAYAKYLRKDAISRPRPTGSGSSMWIWVVIGTIVVLVLLFLTLVLSYRGVSMTKERAAATEEAHRATLEAERARVEAWRQLETERDREPRATEAGRGEREGAQR